MTVEVLEPHGFCGGVSAALRIALRVLDGADGCVYCLHELVHNRTVVDSLRSRGMVFVEAPNDIPDGATVLFSAHGVMVSVRDEAKRRHWRVVDATCPFVARAHEQARSFDREGVPLVIVGEARHVEVMGIASEAAAVGTALTPEDVDRLPWPSVARVGVVAQTTRSPEEVAAVVAALRSKYSRIELSHAADICTAVGDRQRAVREFAMRKRLGGTSHVGVLVVGDAASSNTARLVDVARLAGAKAWRCATPAEVDEFDFSGVEALGLTSGTSTPEENLEAVRKKIVNCDKFVAKADFSPCCDDGSLR